jgi:hypothetical protein
MTQALLNFDAPAQRHSPTSCAAAEATRVRQVKEAP